MSASLNDRDDEEEEEEIPEDKDIKLQTLDDAREMLNPSDTLKYSDDITSEKITFLSQSSKM